MPDSVVIVGAGQAGLQAAEALRAGGFAGVIDMFGDEPYVPYHRPPLSKAWLAGELQAEQLQIRAPELLAKKHISLHVGRSVAAIDRARRRVRLDDGSERLYSGLVLATGAVPRRLNLPGSNGRGIHVLRTRDEGHAIEEALARCKAQGTPIAVIGGGFIGLEVAATARKQGIAVTVLEAAPRLLGRVLSPSLSAWYAALHRVKGAEVILDAKIHEFVLDATGALTAIRLADRIVPAVLAVVGVGVTPNDRLAHAAGLECEQGIVVDACGRTSDPHIVAAGDCTARRLASGQLLRLESVQNATEQGKSAAAALLEQERPFIATPWFWSEQYDKKLQMAGLSSGATQWALRGDMAGESFSVFHYAGERLLAVDSVNAAKDHLVARKILDAGLSPTMAQATDLGFNLADLLR